MLVAAGRYDEAYKNILASSRAADWAGGAPSSVLLLVATDVDALCAAHMLVELLTIDCVGYRVRPVSGWPDMEKAFAEEIFGNEELRTVVLVNLGASIDLYLDIEWPKRTQVHVVDSHRPHQWHNLWLSDAENIHVWDDGDVATGMQDEHEAFLGLRADAERRATLRRMRGQDSDAESDSDESEDESEEDDTDAEGSDRSGKRLRLDEDGNALPKKMSRAQLNLFRKRKNKYYGRGSWYGQSVAGQMYSLATSLNRGNNNLLWHALVGLTHMFTANLVDRETYGAHLSAYADEVERLRSSDDGPIRPFKAHGPADRSIRPSEELRFMLVRHWNLYDAMLHSSYVAGKLKLWRDRGRRNLNNLLAKMGFSLQQCQQTYAHMAMDLKQSLQQKIDSLAPEYGLNDLTYPSFLRASGYQSLLSASDTVEAVGALLEASHGVRLDFGAEGFMTWDAYRSVCAVSLVDANADKENRAPNGGAAGAAPAAKAKAADGALGEDAHTNAAIDLSTTRNFWTAWDALGDNCRLLRSALPLSMALHRSIIRQGASLLDKQAIRPLQGFRLAVLDEGPDLPVFAHPATLSRLALWLVDAVREVVFNVGVGAGARRELPFVVAALDERRATYLVVGVNGPTEYGDVRKNRFANKFREAYDAVLAESEDPESDDRVRLERFESSIVEVKKDALRPFLGKLNLQLVTY